MDLSIIQTKIFELRGQRVMLDFDLAALYGVETKVLKQSVRRNIVRFEGADFMFELTNDEVKSLIYGSRSQIVTLNTGRGGNIKYAPWAFTEQGVAMLSSVLKSEVAIQINREIIRAFTRMRSYLVSQQVISSEVAELRSRLQLVEHEARENLEAMNDLSEDVRRDIDNIFEAIGALSVSLQAAKNPKQKIGSKK